MEQRKLSSLPPSDDVYWDLSEKGEVNKKDPKKCKHHFVHRTSREVECTNCHMGYYIDPPMKIRKGHIYIDEETKSKFVI